MLSFFVLFFFEHQETKSSFRRAGGDTEKRAPGGGSKYYRFWKHRGSAKYRHQSQRVRTLSRGVEVVREGTPQNVSFGTPF